MSLLAPFVDTATGRAVFTVPRPAPAELPGVDGLLAGAAEVDLTPPPGLPRSGSSRGGHDGRGFRTRLRARVVHLRAGTTSLALVALDLLAGSSVLQHLVARQLRERGVDVPIEGLFLGATHTHAAPGGYHGSAFYNRFAANRAGFDPAWTGFLVERVTDAVAQAVATRRPARMAVGTTPVWGYTRNRSLAARVRNPTVADPRQGPDREFAEIDPDLHLLRVDVDAPDGGHQPLAAFAVFAIHGTAVGRQERGYHADVWNDLVGALGDGIERTTGTRPVVGAVEGAHGDIAPAVTRGRAGFPECRRLGEGIARAAVELFERLEGSLGTHVALAAGLRELDVVDADRGIDGIELAPAAVGAPQLVGVKDDTPLVHVLPPFRPGTPRPFGPAGPHGAKWLVLGPRLQRRVLPGEAFPRYLPVQVLRLGGTLLVGLPLELTAEAGRRVRVAVEAAVGDTPVGRVVVSSVANEYWGYCTTPEEYAQQCYEGGHTLHGPDTTPWAARQAAALAAAVLARGRVADLFPERRFDLPTRRGMPTPTGTATTPRFASWAIFHDATPRAHAHWEMRWADVPPGDLVWHEPFVRVESWDPAHGWVTATRHGRPVDDQRGDVSVLHLGEGRGRHRYAARWHDPWLGGGRRHRVVLAGRDGRPDLASPELETGGRGGPRRRPR